MARTYTMHVYDSSVHTINLLQIASVHPLPPFLHMMGSWLVRWHAAPTPAGIPYLWMLLSDVHEQLLY